MPEPEPNADDRTDVNLLCPVCDREPTVGLSNDYMWCSNDECPVVSFDPREVSDE